MNEFTASSHAQTQQVIAIEAAKARRALVAAEDRVKKSVMALEDSQQRIADVQEEVRAVCGRHGCQPGCRRLDVSSVAA